MLRQTKAVQFRVVIELLIAAWVMLGAAVAQKGYIRPASRSIRTPSPSSSFAFRLQCANRIVNGQMVSVIHS
jgi:hypothetical protein